VSTRPELTTPKLTSIVVEIAEYARAALRPETVVARRHDPAGNPVVRMDGVSRGPDD
jgi:hypothetical protein